MNIKITEDDAIWEQVFRNEFYKQNMEVSDISHHDMSDICSYQKEEHNSLKGTLPDSGFSVENSSNYFYPRLNISNGNKGSTIFEGGNIFSAKNLDSRSCIECDNPDFQMIDSDEKEWCNFIEHSGQKAFNNYEIGVSGDLNSQEIGHDYNFSQKTILNENNLEENAYLDYDNHDFEADKDNAERVTKRKSKNANSKSSLSEKRGVAKLQKTYISGNKSQSYIADYPIREMEGGISSRLRSRDGMGGVLGSSIRNPKIPLVLNYGQTCDAGENINPKSSLSKKCGRSNAKRAKKRRSKNVNNKANLSRKRGRTKSKKTCIKNNKSQLYADNYPMQEWEGGISYKLGSMNSMIGVLGPSIGRNSKVKWGSNYSNPRGAIKRKSKNADIKSNLNKDRDMIELQKTCIGYDESQLHIDNHMTFELKGDSSCVLGSTNVVVKISGPSVGDTTVLWT